MGVMHAAVLCYLGKFLEDYYISVELEDETFCVHLES